MSQLSRDPTNNEPAWKGSKHAVQARKTRTRKTARVFEKKVTFSKPYQGLYCVSAIFIMLTVFVSNTIRLQDNADVCGLKLLIYHRAVPNKTTHAEVPLYERRQEGSGQLLLYSLFRDFAH